MLGPNPLHYRRNLACRISPPADQSELSIRCIIGLQDSAGVITPALSCNRHHSLGLYYCYTFKKPAYGVPKTFLCASWPSSWHILAIKLAHLGHKVGKSWPSSSHILAIKFAHLIHQVRTSWPQSSHILSIKFPQLGHQVCAS